MNAAGAVLGILGAAAVVYASVVAAAWLRYGRAAPVKGFAADPLLDRFMPAYDVVERHAIVIRARSEIAFLTAYGLNLQDSRVVSALFRLRAMLLGAVAPPPPAQAGLVAQMQAQGWAVLAEVPDQEIVLGAVTRPWEADFCAFALAPDTFAAFNGPGFVKVVWTLRAEPTGEGVSRFLTETRAVATDADARRRFRWYWARFSIGVKAIRWISLITVKSAAERRARQLNRAHERATRSVHRTNAGQSSR